MHGVLKLSDTVAYEVTAPVTPGEIPVTISKSTTGSAATSTLTSFSAIGLAFLGGIILNLMPCVFPVLFLKGLALVQSSGEERSRLRSHGLVYTLGILVSFWAIVAVLLILRAGGTQAGWGFQLQSPSSSPSSPPESSSSPSRSPDSSNSASPSPPSAASSPKSRATPAASSPESSRQ